MVHVLREQKGQWFILISIQFITQVWSNNDEKLQEDP